jgi:hypothetical protein
VDVSVAVGDLEESVDVFLREGLGSRVWVEMGEWKTSEWAP